MRRPHLRWFVLCALVVLLASACGEPASDGAASTLTPGSTVAVAATTTTVAATTTAAAASDGWDLAELGPYGMGTTFFEATNPFDGERPLRVTAFYPAVTPSTRPEPDAPPDLSDKPYPVVVGAYNDSIFGPHFASHGFVLLAVETQAPTEEVDSPLELSAALDALENLSSQPLAGLADTDQTGVIGYSGESLYALMLAGVRIDPDHWTATCDAPPDGWGEDFETMVCSDSPPIVAERAEVAGIATTEGLWGSLRDERIKASMPMGPRGFYLAGPEGLSTAEAPILMIVGSADEERAMETVSILEYYPTGLASAITLVDTGHLLIFDADAFAQIRGFALAFFNAQLRGEEEYAHYLTKEFVEEVAPIGDTVTFDSLVWGVPPS